MRIKKVSITSLKDSVTGEIIDSMNPGSDQTTNAPSINAVKEYMAPTITVDSNGWTIIDHHSYKECCINLVRNEFVGANGWGSYSVVAIPTYMNSSYPSSGCFFSSSVVCNDAALSFEIGVRPGSGNISGNAKNQYGQQLSNMPTYYSLRIIDVR